MHPYIICTPAVTQEFGLLTKLRTNKYGGSGTMVDPSAHQQPINVLKHLVYVWSGCGNHSMWVWGLNQCTLTFYLYTISVTKEFGLLTKLRTNKMVVAARWWIHLPINSILMLSNSKCFSTLRCCGWAYGCTLMLIHLCRWGCIFGFFGGLLTPIS